MRRSTLLAVALTLLAACDDADGPRDEPHTTPDLSPPDATPLDTAPEDLTATPSDTTSDGCTDGRVVTIVTGRVVDTGGAPVAGARPQACIRQPSGRLICLRPGESADDGTFAQAVPFDAQCMAALTMRVLLPGHDFATTYCRFELEAGGRPVLALPDDLVLHPTTRATTLPPPADATTPRTVVFASGAQLDLVPADLYSGSSAGYAELAATAPLPPEAPGLCALDGDAPAPLGLVAFSPEADLLSTRATLRLPNTDGLEPGTRLDFDVLGGLDCRLADDTLVPEGTWAPAGTATVSEDGAAIELAAVPCLTWLKWQAR